MSTISIRPFQSTDTPALIKLFRDAVHAINIRHYSPEQVAAWAPKEINEDKWRTSLAKNITLVAEIDGRIVGFADMTHDGYLDHFYIHKDYRGGSVANSLFKAIEQAARDFGISKITTHCSITAKLPAERKGFKVIKEQVVKIKEIEFINYIMEKHLK